MTDPLFELELHLAAKGSRDARRTLYEQLKSAIVDGRLAPGARLPATRRSQACFGVSRNTAAEIYDRLLNEGYLVARAGSGTFVVETLPPSPPVALTTDADYVQLAAGRFNPVWQRNDVVQALQFWQDTAQTTSPVAPAPGIDLRPALVDARMFPFDVLRRLLARQLRSLEIRPPRFRSPQGNQGNFALRQAITQHVSTTRALACHADDVLVTSGAQQAFDLLARVLVTPGQTVVALEEPGYPPLRAAFAAAGALLATVRVDAEGMVVDDIPANATVICVSPSHQFPLGVTTSAQRRKALVAAARCQGAVLIEDDYDGEFRFEDNPLAALRTGDAADVVFYVGTFSKCMLPTLRLGFVVPPRWAMSTLVTAKNCLDWHCPTALQMGVAAFIAEGHLAHHVRKMRQVYDRRRRLLLDALSQEFSPWLQPIASSYGMHLTAFARGGFDVDLAAERLRQSQVKLHSLKRYHAGVQHQPGLVFGYGAADLEELKQALALLSEVLPD